MINMRTRTGRLAATVCASLVGFVIAGAGTAIATGGFSGGDQVMIQALPSAPTAAAPVWATNASGQTYGSLLKSTSSATDPELVQAIATNGKTGYVYSSQLNPAAPATPAVALAQQSASTSAQYIPVYAQDGTTVIGQFQVSRPGADAR